MSTLGQFNVKNPTIKRILKEAAELAAHPSRDIHAAPLDTNLFEWHFTLRGPPNSAFATGLYHGRILLPPTYPLRPPAFRFLTPSGRFEPNREICLSISGHHEETWQPAWGVRTALVALRAFMETEPAGQLGGVQCDEGTRRALAGRSGAWVCRGCGGRANGEIMREAEERAAAMEEEGGGAREGESEAEVPVQLRLAYREELGGQTVAEKADPAEGLSIAQHASAQTPLHTQVQVQTQTQTQPHTQVQAQAQSRTPTQSQRRPRRVTSPHSRSDAWLDKAIYILGALLAFLVLRKVAAFVS